MKWIEEAAEKIRKGLERQRWQEAYRAMTGGGDVEVCDIADIIETCMNARSGEDHIVDTNNEGV